MSNHDNQDIQAALGQMVDLHPESRSNSAQANAGMQGPRGPIVDIHPLRLPTPALPTRNISAEISIPINIQ